MASDVRDFKTRFHVESFRAMFKGLKAQGKDNYEAFAQGIALTSDASMGRIVTSPKSKSIYIKYLQMIKGNAICALHYYNEGKKRVGKKTIKSHCTTIDEVNYLVRELKHGV